MGAVFLDQSKSPILPNVVDNSQSPRRILVSPYQPTERQPIDILGVEAPPINSLMAVIPSAPPSTPAMRASPLSQLAQANARRRAPVDIIVYVENHECMLPSIRCLATHITQIVSKLHHKVSVHMEAYYTITLTIEPPSLFSH